MNLENKDLAKLLLSFREGVTFVNTDEDHYKFWHIAFEGNDVYTHYGRIGKAIRESHKSFSSEFERERFVESKIIEKRKKGYKQL